MNIKNIMLYALSMLILGLALLPNVSYSAIHSYTANVNVYFSRTERAGNYSATFNVDTSSLTGNGTETLPTQNFSFNYPLVGSQDCTGVNGTAILVNGVIQQLQLVCGGAYGFNSGFSCDQLGVSCDSNWFGSLGADSYGEGVGLYTLTDNGCVNDEDCDGVADLADSCPATPQGTLINSAGCSISQLCPCDGNWKNRGGYTNCVSNAANAFVTEGLLTLAGKDALVSAAAKSNCGSKK